MLPLALGCIKASFLFFYLRIFAVGRNSGTFRMITGLIILVITWAFAFFLTALFEYRLDSSAIWGSASDILMQCTLIENIVLALCISDFISDLMIICISILLVCNFLNPPFIPHR
jgi:hypothetical protein